jgi:hypothetical protein
MLARRAVLGLALAAGAAFLRPAHVHATGRVRGCCLRQSMASLGIEPSDMVAAGSGSETLIGTSGDPTLDKYLGRALVRIATTFAVRPGFGFFDDSDSENAYATPETRIEGTEGTVLMGTNLFHRVMTGFNDAGIAVLAVCAHEFGHIYQFDSGLADKLGALDRTAKPVELHADFMSGYFLASRKAELPDLNLQGAGRLIDSLGDTAFTAPDHHGTPDERVGAIEGGYDYGRRGRAPVATVADAGADFIRRYL